jgi:hypothetical protein
MVFRRREAVTSMRRLVLLLAVLLFPIAARGQITPVPRRQNYVLHFPGNDANRLLLYTKNATGGTFTLSLNGLTTGALPFDATAAAVQTALSGLTGFSGKVTVRGENGGPYAVLVANTIPVTGNSIDITSLTGPIAISGAFVPYVGAHVDHGRFWGQASGTSLGTSFWWTAWMRPWSQGYLVSDGSGGAHALLWGITPGPANSATGNVYTGSTSITFTGTYGVAAGEWVWVAVGWDGTNIFTYVDGICDGVTAGLTTRTTGTTSGHLYVGGSDHINAGMDLAYLAGWDRTYWTSVGVKTAAIQPARFPTTYSVSPLLYADFAADYTTPAPVIRDISTHGYEEVAGTYPARLHPGVIRTSAESVYDESWLTAYSALVDGAPLPTFAPRWVVDDTCPYGQPYTSPLPKESIPPPATPPGGALVFDSFGRRNQTPAFQHHPTLGRTEAGSLGPLTWKYEFPDSWGILGGKAVPTRGGGGSTSSSLAWVPGVAYNQDVRVTRSLGGANQGSTGLCFRVKDAPDHWFAYVNPTSNNVTVYNYTAGVLSANHTFTTGSTTWTILRVVASGTTITPEVSVDGSTWIVDPAPLTDSVSDPTWNGAGVTTGYHWISSFISSLERCDNFTVFAG